MALDYVILLKTSVMALRSLCNDMQLLIRRCGFKDFIIKGSSIDYSLWPDGVLWKAPVVLLMFGLHKKSKFPGNVLCCTVSLSLLHTVFAWSCINSTVNSMNMFYYICQGDYIFLAFVHFFVCLLQTSHTGWCDGFVMAKPPSWVEIADERQLLQMHLVHVGDTSLPKWLQSDFQYSHLIFQFWACSTKFAIDW